MNNNRLIGKSFEWIKVAVEVVKEEEEKEEEKEEEPAEEENAEIQEVEIELGLSSDSSFC